MQLKSLHIQLDEYGNHKGRYTGQAHFTGQYGGVEIVLHPEVSEQILKLCAEALVRNSKELAEQLTVDILTQTSLPPPPAYGEVL